MNLFSLCSCFMTEQPAHFTLPLLPSRINKRTDDDDRH